MNFDEKISRIMENQSMKKRLNELGIYSIQGPTGPKGNGLQITGAYDTEEELYKQHPSGNTGDCYIINNSLYIWNTYTNKWEKSGSIAGPTGIAEKIKIGNTTTGEIGANAQVIDNFDGSTHVLDFIVPKGEIGPTGPQGVQGEQGIQGIKGEKGDVGPRGLPGEIGISEVITIDGTETIESDESAEVHDDFDSNVHHLTFYIPKGEKGEQGIQGEIGPTGPRGTLGPTSYSSIAFASFMDTTTAGIIKLGSRRLIPGINNIITMPNNTDINISETGAYEITLCGRISGVTQDVGASFMLYNTTENEVVSDLIFELNKGNTPDMDFSETNVVDIYAPATLQLKATIDDTSANIKFTYMNIIIKAYNS